jgi:hypothetical protein
MQTRMSNVYYRALPNTMAVSASLCAGTPCAPIKRLSNPESKSLPYPNHSFFRVSCREEIFDAHSSTAYATIGTPPVCVEH